MAENKNWKTDYFIKNLLTRDYVKQLPEDELRSLFEKVRTDFDTYSRKRYGPLKKSYVKKVFEPAPTKAEYDRTHAEEKMHVVNNLAVTRDEMEERGLSRISI